MRLVLVVVLGDLLEVEPLIPSALLCLSKNTFSLILLAMVIWLRDLLREILVTESYDCDGL
jgi:hypothetical protein